MQSPSPPRKHQPSHTDRVGGDRDSERADRNDRIDLDEWTQNPRSSEGAMGADMGSLKAKMRERERERERVR